MKKIRWSPDKSAILQPDPTRGRVGLEECVVAIEGGKTLAVVLNPSTNHPSQKMFVLNINNYAYCVPFVETEEELFLKTIFPSRRFTALYLNLTGQSHEED
jgi:hypothetical protein